MGCIIASEMRRRQSRSVISKQRSGGKHSNDLFSVTNNVMTSPRKCKQLFFLFGLLLICVVSTKTRAQHLWVSWQVWQAPADLKDKSCPNIVSRRVPSAELKLQRKHKEVRTKRATAVWMWVLSKLQHKFGWSETDLGTLIYYLATGDLAVFRYERVLHHKLYMQYSPWKGPT